MIVDFLFKIVYTAKDANLSAISLFVIKDTFNG